jgi:uncharacterized membrane protein (DUF485 family)
MNALESLRKRAGTLVFGLVSFLVVAAAMRWSNGEPIFQPSGDIGIVIGVALVALYFVLSDARASKAGPQPGRARELN